jgi:hypothetical protein
MSKKKKEKPPNWCADAIRRPILLSAQVGPEQDRYEMLCLDCGHKGYCVESLNDWGGTTTWWHGFINLVPNIEDIEDPDDSDAMEPLCICGSTRIVRAEVARMKSRKRRRPGRGRVL